MSFISVIDVSPEGCELPTSPKEVLGDVYGAARGVLVACDDVRTYKNRCGLIEGAFSDTLVAVVAKLAALLSGEETEHTPNGQRQAEQYIHRHFCEISCQGTRMTGVWSFHVAVRLNLASGR